MTFHRLSRLFKMQRRRALRLIREYTHTRRSRRVHVAEQPVRHPSEIRSLLRENPQGVVVTVEDVRTFGFDPEVLARREKEVEAGNYVPASDFFNGLRARVRSGG